MLAPNCRDFGICFACATWAVLSSAFADKPSKDLSQQSDEQLRAVFVHQEFGIEDERLLAEVVRRGGEEWQKRLADRHAEIVRRIKVPRKPGDRFDVWGRSNLELLTAWRRVQKKSDPLQILIAGELERSYSFIDSPRFTASIVNLDESKETVYGFTFGGNDHSGRRARWRFEVRDENGRLQPILAPPGPERGGVFQLGPPLNFEESWRAEFCLKDYIAMPTPGRYTLRLYYHNQDEIDDVESIEDRITLRSREMKIEIRPLRISVSAEERKKIRDWIGGLPEKGPVKILMDGQTSNPKILDPESPAGQLYRAREDAIPDLIDAALDPELSPERRAWVLGILFGITGHNDPRDGPVFFPGILGSYESDRGFSKRRTIDAKKQADFAERWRVWKSGDYFSMEER